MKWGITRKRAALAILPVLLAAAFLIFINRRPSALPRGISVDRIHVDKKGRLMTLYAGMRPVRTYRVSLGESPRGNKEREGDRRTPEGTYSIETKNPQSDYHLSLLLSYPELEDMERAEARGDDPGCDIALHGLKKGYGWVGRMHSLRDWTYGCIAVSNAEMDQIYHALEEGVLVEIEP